jgi:hypothetical protein
MTTFLNASQFFSNASQLLFYATDFHNFLLTFTTDYNEAYRGFP